MPDLEHTICLNMIVRDESHIITDCLESVSQYIDYWIICDTGSTDDTADVIESFFREKGIPGELHHHEWKDFAHNRNLALDLVKGKARYAWVIDADDYLVGNPDFSQLEAGSYDFFYRLGDNCSYWRRQLFRMDLPWRYEGVVHEYPTCDEKASSARLPGEFHIVARVEGGARNSDGNKFRRDVELLSKAVADDPADSRSVFYLAQSYYDQGDSVNAEKWYRRRSEMGGWQEEVFYSLMRVGLAKEAQGAEFSEVRSAMLEAWESRPQRAEPLYHLARITRLSKRWNEAYLYAKHASYIPFPDSDALFVDESVWRWRIQDELSIAAYWTGKFKESKAICSRLLQNEQLPVGQQTRVSQNLNYALSALEG